MSFKNLLKLLIILCLAIGIGLAGVFCCTEGKRESKWPIPPSANKQFLLLQQTYEKNLQHTLTNLLEPLAGPGKVRVAVTLDLDLKNAQIHHHSQTKNLIMEQDNTQTHLDTDTIEKQVQNAIQRQHISIVIDGLTTPHTKNIYQPRTPQEMETYAKLVKSAIGYNPSRGDTLEIQNMPFVFHSSPQNASKKSVLLFIYFVLLMASFLLLIYPFTGDKNTSDTKKTQTDFSAKKLNQILQFPERATNVFKNWIYLPSSPKSSDWTPLQKVGIVLLTAEEDFVRQVLIALDDDEVRKISKVIATLGVIPPYESTRILNELYEAMFVGSTVIGNPVRAQQILMQNTKKSFCFTEPTWQSEHQPLWQELENISSQTLASKLETLSPELAAYILYQLSAQKAAETIPYFSATKTNQVLIHLSHIGQMRTETNQKMAEQALTYARRILDTLNTPSGDEKTVEILAQMKETSVGQNIIHNLSQQSPSLAKKLTAHLIRFEDLANWSPKAIRTLLKHTPRTTVLYALMNAPRNILKQIQDNIPAPIWQALEKEIQEKHKQILPDQIAQARQKIVEIARTLLNQDKIEI